MLRAGRIRYQSRRLLDAKNGEDTYPGSKSINGCTGPNACGNYDYDCDGAERRITTKVPARPRSTRNAGTRSRLVFFSFANTR